MTLLALFLRTASVPPALADAIMLGAAVGAAVLTAAAIAGVFK